MKLGFLALLVLLLVPGIAPLVISQARVTIFFRNSSSSTSTCVRSALWLFFKVCYLRSLICSVNCVQANTKTKGNFSFIRSCLTAEKDFLHFGVSKVFFVTVGTAANFCFSCQLKNKTKNFKKASIIINFAVSTPLLFCSQSITFWCSKRTCNNLFFF